MLIAERALQQDFEEQAGVSDGTSDRSRAHEVRHPAERAVVLVVVGRLGECRFDAEQPAERRRDPDGAAAVRAEGDARQSGSDARGSTAAGATGGQTRIPRVGAGRSEPVVSRR